MRGWSRLLTIVLSAALAFLFAVQNGRELVDVRLGPLTVRASLPAVVFGAILLGMIVVFLVGLRADMQARIMMRRYRERLDRDD
jgi:uncharacterized integral membrane protein